MSVKGVYYRKGIAYICYRDETGRIARESSRQKSLRVAQAILAKRKSEVAMGAHFPARKFEEVKFGELATCWWEEHGRRTRSCFGYVVPRIRERFGVKRAREIRPEHIRKFLRELADRYSASYVNAHRTVLSGIFSFATKHSRYDQNPVKAVPQINEGPGRDRFLPPDDFKLLLDTCGDDVELKVFTVVLGTTTMRKGELLPRRWAEVHLDGETPDLFVPRTKNKDPKRVPLSRIVAEVLKQLPSYGEQEYLFPARPTNRYPDPSRFNRPYRWDMRKKFLAACKTAKIKDLRIHDLRHMSTSILFCAGVPDNVIAKLTGHRGRTLDCYKHLSPQFRSQTVELIARILGGPTLAASPESRTSTDTATDTVPQSGPFQPSESKPKRPVKEWTPNNLGVVGPSGLEPLTSTVSR